MPSELVAGGLRPGEALDGIILRELRVRLIRDAMERASWDDPWRRTTT